MALTVLSVACPFAPVGGEMDGAAAQVLTALDAALVRNGHRSVVVAAEGSSVLGTLVSVPRAPDGADDAMRAATLQQVADLVADAVERYAVDLVHFHGRDFAACLPPAGVTTLVTLHQWLDDYPRDALAPTRPDTHLHGVSAAQMRSAPPGLALLPPIETGVAVDRLHIRVPKRRFVVGLGRIERGKGFHIALDAARDADMQLLLAGEVPRAPDAQRYCQDEIRPRLEPKHRLLGAIGFGRKRWMLGAARALLAPSLVPEPSGLVALEALACGAPVVAFPSGALADIVEPGVTGFLVNDVAEMAVAIADAETLDPDACRAAARARHSQEAMTTRYLERYETLLSGIERSAGVARA